MQISWHPVSRDVGNVRNHEKNLSAPVELDKRGKPVDKKSGNADMMKNWLLKGKKESKKDDDAEPELKKAKKEN